VILEKSENEGREPWENDRGSVVKSRSGRGIDRESEESDKDMEMK
jgi:hypothetical protein